MIEQVSSHTAHPTFGHAILPWTAECGSQRLAAHSLYRRSDIDAKLGIAVEEQEALRLLALLPGLAQLQRNPNRLWTTSHVAVQDSAPVVGDHEEAIQNAKGEGRIGQGHACRQSSNADTWAGLHGDLHAADRRLASPLRGRRLNHPAVGQVFSYLTARSIGASALTLRILRAFPRCTLAHRPTLFESPMQLERLKKPSDWLTTKSF